jgi:hypothetical protein
MTPRPTHPRRRTAARFGAALLAVLGSAAACTSSNGDEDPSWLAAAADAALVHDADGGGSDRASESGQPSSGTEATTEDGDPGSDPVGAPDPSSDTGSGPEQQAGGAGDLPSVVTPADLEPFLVQGSDLPIGWIVVGRELPPREGLGGCEPVLASAVRASVSLQRGTSGPVVSNVVTDHASTEVAQAEFWLLRGTVAGCLRALPGVDEDVPIEEIDLGADEAIAVTIRVSDGSDEVEGRLLYARVGARTTSVLVLAPDVDGTSFADAAADAVIGRLRAG